MATADALLSTLSTIVSGQNSLEEAIQHKRWQGTPGGWVHNDTQGTAGTGAYYTQISNTTTPATYTTASNINLTTGETS